MTDDNGNVEERRTPLWGFIIFAGAALGIQVAAGYVIYRTLGNWPDRGTFGDMFGAVNALFSGLALAGIIYAMFMQREELQLQRRDTRRNTAQLRRAAEAEENAAMALAAQAEALRASLAEAKAARDAKAFFELLPILNNIRPHWHEVYGFPVDPSDWTPEQRRLADHVGTELQRVAYVCVSGLINPIHILEGYAKVFDQCWSKLEPFIRSYRIASNEPPDLIEGSIQQRMHLERFVHDCRVYLKARSRSTRESPS